MTPVISPWVFYWMPVCESIKMFCGFVGFVSLGGAIIAIVCGVTEVNSHYRNDEFIKITKSLYKKLFPIGITLMLIATLIPTEKTITKMLIAQNVTYERVEMATDTVETVYNDIMELFEDSDG